MFIAYISNKYSTNKNKIANNQNKCLHLRQKEVLKVDLLFDMIKIVWSLPEESDDHKAICDVSL